MLTVSIRFMIEYYFSIILSFWRCVRTSTKVNYTFDIKQQIVQYVTKQPKYFFLYHFYKIFFFLQIRFNLIDTADDCEILVKYNYTISFILKSGVLFTGNK